jgi:hypothetical protein
VLAAGYQHWNGQCQIAGPVAERLGRADQAARFVLLTDAYLGELAVLQDHPDVAQASACFRHDTSPGLSNVLLVRDGPLACRSSVTGVVVSPSQIAHAPGASQRVTVVVEGTTNQAVTWPVDGG